jgi:hypothetical protein
VASQDEVGEAFEGANPDEAAEGLLPSCVVAVGLELVRVGPAPHGPPLELERLQLLQPALVEASHRLPPFVQTWGYVVDILHHHRIELGGKEVSQCGHYF